MPRELSNAPCEITFDDRISGDKITLYHDIPTSEDRIKYANGFVTRQGNQIVSTVGELRIKAGLKILRGFKKGAFSVPGKGLISSDPADSQYDPAWKAAVRQYAPDVIEMLAIHVFESSLLRVSAKPAPEVEVLPRQKDDYWELDDASGAASPSGEPAGGEAAESPLS